MADYKNIKKDAVKLFSPSKLEEINSAVSGILEIDNSKKKEYDIIRKEFEARVKRDISALLNYELIRCAEIINSYKSEYSAYDPVSSFKKSVGVKVEASHLRVKEDFISNLEAVLYYDVYATLSGNNKEKYSYGDTVNYFIRLLSKEDASFVSDLFSRIIEYRKLDEFKRKTMLDITRLAPELKAVDAKFEEEENKLKSRIKGLVSEKRFVEGFDFLVSGCEIVRTKSDNGAYYHTLIQVNSPCVKEIYVPGLPVPVSKDEKINVSIDLSVNFDEVITESYNISSKLGYDNSQNKFFKRELKEQEIAKELELPEKNIKYSL